MNVLLGPGDRLVGVGELARAGVRRISTGVALHTRAMGTLRDAADQLASGHIGAATNGMPFLEAVQLITKATTPGAGS